MDDRTAAGTGIRLDLRTLTDTMSHMSLEAEGNHLENNWGPNTLALWMGLQMGCLRAAETSKRPATQA